MSALVFQSRLLFSRCVLCVCVPAGHPQGAYGGSDRAAVSYRGLLHSKNERRGGALVNGIVSLPGKCGRTLQSGTGRLCVRPVVDLFPDMNN